SRRRHTRFDCDWSSDVCSSDLRRSVLELTSGDRPGLLCEVGRVLMEERVELQAAKIMTVGERAEDVFHLTDFDNCPLTPQAAERSEERRVGKECISRRWEVELK